MPAAGSIREETHPTHMVDTDSRSASQETGYVEPDIQELLTLTEACNLIQSCEFTLRGLVLRIANRTYDVPLRDATYLLEGVLLGYFLAQADGTPPLWEP